MDYNFSELYKNDIENINKFLSQRPDTIGVYCYGIGESFCKKIYKLILVVEDIWKWQQINDKKNEFTMYCNLLYNNGYNFIEYIGIRENNCIFDYTLMNSSEFIENLVHWKNFSYSEIFQRPFITIKSINELDKLIKRNQNNALIMSLLMLNSNKSHFFDLMLKLYCISSQITNDKLLQVDQNYEFLKSIYQDSKYFDIDEFDNITINREKLLNDILYLPKKIKRRITVSDEYIDTSLANCYLESKVEIEASDIDYMRTISNGFLKTFDYNGRKNKIKSLKKSEK